MAVFSLGTIVDFSVVHKPAKLDKKLMKGRVKSFAFFMVLKKERSAREG